MKRLAILLFLAAPAYAGTLTLSTTAADDAVIDAERLYVNEQTCKTWGLNAGCGTGAVRAAFCAQEGSDSPTPPCTVNGVSSATVRIYPDAADFAERILKQWAFSAKQTQDARKLEAFAEWRKSANRAARNAVCTAAGLPAGCLP
jgi:hydroxyethylthiazole kinase-like sugar kinase family protein